MEGPQLSISIEPSRTLCALLTLLHAAAILAPWAADLALLARLALSLAAACSWLATWRAWRLERRAGPWTLRLHDGAWSLERGGRVDAFEPAADTTVWERLVVLRARSADACVRTFVLLPDSCAAGDLRRLRVALRMTGGVSRAGPG